MSTAYPIHPFAQIFPQMTGEEWDAFLADVHEHGVRQPIVLYEGKVLDGRHRLQAVQEIAEKWGRALSVEFTAFDGTAAEAMALVYSLNMARRHLSVGQRACLGAEIKERLPIRPGNPNRDDEGRFTICGKNATNGEDRNLPARDIAGKIVHVSGRSIDRAAQLKAEAPDLYESVRSGEMPLTVAANQLAVRNGTQTKAQAVAAVVSEVLTATGVAEITPEKLEKIGRVVANETTNIHVSDDSYEWHTPAPILEAARALMGGIDLDPASSNAAQETVQAESFYTKAQNGLQQPWAGRVFLNPPYSMPLVQEFSLRCHTAYQAGDITEAVLLINNATETRYFQTLAACYPVCFPAGRLAFVDPDGEELAGRQGQAIFYLGRRQDEFIRLFAPFGVVVRRAA